MLSLPASLQTSLDQSILRLDAWLQTMRQSGGYGGPISHWWENSLIYCGPMIDWRYEGILCGYVTLYRQTGEARWLERALQAGEDVVAAQLPSGNFRNSAFQQGPIEGGTPHESAVDVGLLELARLLKELNDPAWERYFQTAERNILRYQIGALWNGQGFLDQPWNTTMVPNKNGTLIEALILYESLSGQDVSHYIRAAARVILSAQEKDGPRAGGIVHLGTGRHRLAIGIYNARSVCGLLRAYDRDPIAAYRDAAAQSLRFISGLLTEDGVYFGRYPDGSLIANPRIIAGAGDVLRAFYLGSEAGLIEPEVGLRLLKVLLDRQHPSGGFPTAAGFHHRGSKRVHRGTPDFRDVLPVVGWCDKVFRALSLMFTGQEYGRNPFNFLDTYLTCQWKAKQYLLVEDCCTFRLINGIEKEVFRWYKKSCLAQINQL